MIRPRVAAILLATALAQAGPAVAATGELVCTSLLTRKAALDSMNKRLQLLDSSCARSRTRGPGIGDEFCEWAEEARRELNRCRGAAVPWASSITVRFDPDKAQDDRAELRQVTCYTFPEPETVDAAIATTTPATITVAAKKAKQLHERYARPYQPLVIDRKTLSAGYGSGPEFSCKTAGAAGPKAR